MSKKMKKSKKSNGVLEITNVVPRPVKIKQEKIKTENDESDIGSDFYNDSIFDSSDQETNKAPKAPAPSPSVITKKDARLIPTKYCLQLYKDRKKISSLQNTRTTMTLTNKLMLTRTNFYSPLASQKNVCFGFSSNTSGNMDVSNSKLFTLPTRTKQLTRMFGFYFKNLNTPLILRGHEKIEKLRNICKKKVSNKYIEKYKKKQTKRAEKDRRKKVKREKDRQVAVQELVTNIIPKLDYAGVMKVMDLTKNLNKI